MSNPNFGGQVSSIPSFGSGRFQGALGMSQRQPRNAQLPPDTNHDCQQARCEPGQSIVVMNEYGNPLWEDLKGLYKFEKPGCLSAILRYNSICEQLESSLHGYLATKADPNPRLMSTLKVVGICEGRSTEHILLFCSPGLCKKARAFFDQEVPKKLCNPPRPLPSLPVIVIPREIRPATRETIWVTTSSKPISVGRIAGSPVHFVDNIGRSEQGTIGGVVKIVNQDKTEHLYGLTTAHGLLKLLNSSRDPDQQVMRYNNVHATGKGSVNNEQPLIPEKPTRACGEVSTISTGGSTSQGYYDWALLEMGTVLPNTFDAGYQGGFPEMRVSDKDSFNPQRATMMGRSHKLKPGTLCKMVGRINLGSGKAFTDAYVLSLRDPYRVEDGDSGAWVMDSNTREVFGHVVATDVFNDAYVIPMKDILQDIKSQLGVAGISLVSKNVLREHGVFPELHDGKDSAPRTMHKSPPPHIAHKGSSSSPIGSVAFPPNISIGPRNTSTHSNSNTVHKREGYNSIFE